MSPPVERLYQSPEYQELVKAVRAADHVRQAAIIDAELARHQGPERAFWLLLRAARHLRSGFPQANQVWVDLDEALRVGGASPFIRQRVVLSATNLSLLHERVGSLVILLRSLPDRREILHDPHVQMNLGELHMKRGRWGTAFRLYSNGLAGIERLPPEQREAHRGSVASFTARRVVAGFASGRPEQARQDMATVEHMIQMLPPAVTSPAAVALARAEAACAEKDYQTARHALQEGALQRASGKYFKDRIDVLAEVELMAARIARAEGSQVAVEYFCDRALALITHQDLPLTRARIEVIRRGAER